MKSFILSLLVALARAETSNSSAISMSMSMAMSTAANSSAAEYTITALPAVKSQPACIFNCLIPIGLADPSGCDDVTNGCACLSAPNDVLGVLTGCVQTVCKSSTSSYAAVVTSLYESYCQSVFGAPAFSQAFSAEAAAAAASTTTSSSGGSTSSTTTKPTASASGSVIWTPSFLTLGLCAAGGLFSLLAL